MATTKINWARQIEASSITNAQQNFGTPSAASDVAIKSYVDSVAQGLDAKPSAVVATIAVLSPTNTYSNGTSGVGAALTATANGVLTVDGVATVLNDYVLVKNEASGLKNGLYKVTTEGTAWVPYVLTRATEMDVTTEYSGGFIFVQQGSLASTGWVCTNSTNPTVGTTGITFAQFSGAGTYTNGTGLSLSGSTFSIDTTVTVDKTTVQTLTNKTLTSPAITTPTGIVKGDVGLWNVDNTSDANKPVSTAQQTALNLKANLASPTFTGTVVLPAAQIVNGVTLSTAQGTWNFLRWDGTYAAISSSTYFRADAISGTQNSSNKVFTLASAVSAGSEQIFINGQLLTPWSGNDYVISGTTVTFEAGFTAPASTDTLRAYGNY